MAKIKFGDPIGPGTPAWDACDRAIEAREQAFDTRNPARRKRLIKRYYNQRQYCIKLLTNLGAPKRELEGWLRFMDIRLGKIEG